MTLPSAGLVYLDTDAVIYSVEKNDPYAQLLQPPWLAAQAGSFIVVSSELTLLETLVKPFRDGDAVLATALPTTIILTPHCLRSSASPHSTLVERSLRCRAAARAALAMQFN